MNKQCRRARARQLDARWIAASAVASLVACGPSRSPSVMAPRFTTEPTPGNMHPRAPVPDIPLPDPATTTQVSLAEILAYADAHAPAIHVTRERLSLEDAALAGASPWFPDNPELSIAAGPRFASGDATLDLEASLRQRIEIAGERGLRLEVAETVGARLAAELSQIRWQVHSDVHAAFHDALVARERERAAARLVTFQEGLEAIAVRRFEAGAISPLVVRIAEGQTAQAKVAHIEAEQVYATARLSLAELSGWPAMHPPEPEGVLDPPRKAPPLSDLMALAKKHQPRYRTLAMAIAEAEARARLADREAWPAPAFGITAAREGSSETIVLGSLSIPVPMWRTNRGERTRARAHHAIALARAQAFSQRLTARLARAKGAVDSAARRLAVYGAEILPTFEENLALIRRAYELGEIDILEVSVAQERFLRTQRDALDAYADYFRAVAQLEAAVGTDVWPDESHDGGGS